MNKKTEQEKLAERVNKGLDGARALLGIIFGLFVLMALMVLFTL